MPNTIGSLAQMGYVCGVAHGSVQVEQDALDAALADQNPDLIVEQANTLTTMTISDLDLQGKLPETPEARLDLAQKIAAAALGELTTRADARVALHQRAVAAAQEMPDVWCVQQHAADGALLMQLYVWAHENGSGWDTDHQATIDQLANQAAFGERTYQGNHHHPSVPADDTAEAAAVWRDQVAECAICNPQP